MAELKTANGAKQFQDEAKKYVINMLSGAKTLHIKNGCRDSKALSKYYDFDSMEEVKNSGLPYTPCENCFK